MQQSNTMTTLHTEKVKLKIEVSQAEFNTMTALMEKLDLDATNLIKRSILLQEFVENHIDEGTKFYIQEPGQAERTILFE